MINKMQILQKKIMAFLSDTRQYSEIAFGTSEIRSENVHGFNAMGIAHFDTPIQSMFLFTLQLNMWNYNLIGLLCVERARERKGKKSVLNVCDSLSKWHSMLKCCKTDCHCKYVSYTKSLVWSSISSEMLIFKED